MKTLALMLLAACSAPAATYYVTLAGLGGELDYTQRFKMWADDIDGSLKKAGNDNVVATLVAPQLDQIKTRMATIASQAKPADSLVVILIGHGTYDGREYKFMAREAFEEMADRGEFLEHAHVHGNWYATSATWLRQQVAEGHDVLLEIDWQGAAQVRLLIPSAVLIFILPPSQASLRDRLTKRGQDSPAVIARRSEAAREEMRHCGEFDYVIMNQDFARAVDDLSVIVRAARLTASRQLVRHARLIAELTHSAT